jgi:hypothetical protein
MTVPALKPCISEVNLRYSCRRIYKCTWEVAIWLSARSGNDHLHAIEPFS